MHDRPPTLADHPELRRDDGTGVAALVSTLVRAGREAIADGVPMLASALAYSVFLAIPSVALVAIGVFSLVAGPSVIAELTDRLGAIAPAEAVSLVDDSLRRLEQQPSAGLLMTIVGAALALWSTTGAMATFMAAANRAYDRKDSRGFVHRRLVALVMVACIGTAAVLVLGLLVLGPHLQRWAADAAGAEHVVRWLWWGGQWPLLLAGLLAAFAVLLYLGPDVEERRWRFVTAGAAVATVVWLAVSALFALYASRFGSYDKTWGSLSAVIVMLVWLWLTGIALLYGVEVDAEAERRRGEQARR